MSKTTPHAIIKAKERYDLELTIQDLDDIGRSYKKAGVRLAVQNDNSSIWLVRVKEKLCRVVMSPGGMVKTFLPLNAKLGIRRFVKHEGR